MLTDLISSRTVRRAAVGAVVATATLTAGAIAVSGASDHEELVFVSAVPCRLVDTRPGAANLGPRRAPIAAGEIASFASHAADDGDSACEIPATATALATNVTALRATERTYLTLFATGVTPVPTASNVNVEAGSSPTSNAVTVELSADGELSVRNAFGTVDVIVDVVGWFQPSKTIGERGPAGPQGEPGATGARGATGATGATGAQGAPGPAGPQGEPGPQGAPGVSGYQQVQVDVTLPLDGEQGQQEVECPTGSVVTGGGFASADGSEQLDVWRSFPTGASRWHFDYTVEPGGGGRPALFYAICVTAGA